MKKSRITTAFAILAAIFTACASTTNMPPPAWVTNRLAVYPWDEYIAMRGSDLRRQDAELKAANEIYLYFSREIESMRSSGIVITGQNDVSTVETRTEESILVESQMRMVGMPVRYAEDPWYNSATKTWETVAYIERDEGWLAYESTVQRQADTFLNLVKAADEETEPFNQFLRYGAAAAYADGQEYSDTRAFAQALNPAKAGNLYAAADSALAALVQRRNAARERSSVYVECPVDYNNMIYQAMVGALRTSGFAVEQNRSNTATRCLVQVEEGLDRRDAGTFYVPALTGTISGSKGALFSFRIQGERVGAVSPDVAKQRAYTALADAVEKTFAEELQKRQTSIVRE